MPVIKSAKKKLRKDKKRTLQNKGIKNTLKELIKKAKTAKSEKSVREAVSAADKAVKKHLIHKNKAARIKSTLSKLLPRKDGSAPKAKPTEQKVVKKTPATAKASPGNAKSPAKKSKKS